MEEGLCEYGREKGTQERIYEMKTDRDAEGYAASQTEDGEKKIVAFHHDDDNRIAEDAEMWQKKIEKHDGKERIGNIHPHGINMLTYTFENSVSDMVQVHQGDDGREDKQMRGGDGGMINQI